MAAYILESLCIGCQRCVRTCPNEAIKMLGHHAVVHPNACNECEECMEACMQGAITVQPHEGAF